jgi:NHS family xanthosine MFS transporter
VWGTWLITIANYWFGTKQWSGSEFGAIFSTLGISSIFMPAIVGLVADRWINAEKLYGILHIFSGLTVFCLPMVNDPNTFFLDDAFGNVLLYAHYRIVKFHSI